MIYCFSSTFFLLLALFLNISIVKEERRKKTSERNEETNEQIYYKKIVLYMRNCNCIELRKKKGHPDYNIIKPTNYNNKIYLIYMEQEIRGNSLYIYNLCNILCLYTHSSYQ